MNKHLTYSIIISIFMVCISCSTKKNTGVRRVYHNVTSRYNILFNGTESYKSGINSLWESYPDDYTQILPIFLYSSENALSGISSQMDRAIKKATKLVAMHSITVKPEIDTEKELTAKQKAFMNKNEYNKYVDEAYLLLGKAHFHKIEYSQARETFNFIVTKFPDNTSVFEAKLWLAKISIQNKRFRESEDILQSLDHNLEFPKKIRDELHATLADHYFKQEQVNLAIEHLHKALDFTNEKRKRIRYTFILAQLYAEVENFTAASKYYSNVIKMNPPYTMTFNAKINRALNYQSGTGSRKDIEKQLDKMLKDDKNIEYQDQIYYARGNLFYTDGNIKTAIENYKLSLSTNVDNTQQKALSSLTLANIYYEIPDYINAQAYYDSAVAVIEPDYPNYDIIYAKSTSLNRLVENVNTVHFEDSVLVLAEMPKDDLMIMIDDLIEKEIQYQEEQALLQQQLAEERMERMANESLITGSNDAGKWYFYNQQIKTMGKKEFVQSWGNRKLEDNWRRKNKSSAGFDNSYTDEEDMEGEEGEETQTKVTYITNKKKPEFYLQYIPFTDSAKEVSLKRIEKALYHMGEIYGSELKDYPKATESYEELIRHYPKNNNKLHVYYRLYTIAKEQEDKERVSKYQQKIISEFPRSNFAKLMTNPNYIEEIRRQEMIVYRQYDQLVEQLNQGKYGIVSQAAQIAMANYPDHVLMPQIEYIYTVSKGALSDTLSFIKSLGAYIAKYPNTETASNAELLIGFLQNGSPEILIQQKREKAEELFSRNLDEPHYFIYLSDHIFNFNQLRFNLIDFNLENFDELKLEIKRVELNKGGMLAVVQKFENSNAAKKYLTATIINRETVFRDVDPEGLLAAVISETNLAKLTETGETGPYLIFYKENY